MDAIDLKLLHLLQEDTTHSIAELAECVGLSSTPCWKRVQKLETTGVILRRVALLDPERIGMGLTVFVAVEAYDHTPDCMQEFTKAVSAMPEVMELYRMAGDVDYMLRVAVADMAAYDAFYRGLIAAIPLKNVTSRFAMERLKHTTAYAVQRGQRQVARGSERERHPAEQEAREGRTLPDGEARMQLPPKIDAGVGGSAARGSRSKAAIAARHPAALRA